MRVNIKPLSSLGLALRQAQYHKSPSYGGLKLLAATLCYRALLNDILDRGYTKVYTHAARYFRMLVRLDKQIELYKEQLTHDQYVAQLRSVHGRKRAFWTKVD